MLSQQMLLSLTSYIESLPDLAESSQPALREWNNAARIAIPIHIKIWLGLLLLNNVATIAFVRNHVAARWVLAGFVVSHLIVMVGYPLTGTTILAGQVSMFHVICWTPGFIMLLLKRDEIKLPTAYGIWACLACIFYLGSMIFDIRDSATFLRHALGS